MLSKLSQFFAKVTPLTVAVWFFILVFGMLAYTSWLPREGFPAVELRTATGGGQFFSADGTPIDAETVDEQILPLLNAVQERDEIKSVTATSRQNSFGVFVQAEESFTAADADDILAAEFESLNLENVEFRSDPLNIALLLGQYDLLIGIRGPVDASPNDLETEAEKLLDFFGGRPGVAKAEVVPLTASALDESGNSVSRQISYTLLTSKNSAGDEFKQFGQAASIGVVSGDGVDAIELRDTIESALSNPELAATLRLGYEAFVAFDYAPQVESEIGSLQSNVLTGILVVAIVALLLITWRASVIAAGFIFTVIATSVGMLWVAGITLNTVSLFGIVLALGLFVDDAIVISEAIYNFRLEGESYIKSIGRAIDKVGAASVSGTLTTILVFAPMLFITGTLGAFIQILPISVMIALAVSLVLSLILIPFASRFLILNAAQQDGVSARLQDRAAKKLSSMVAHESHGRRNAVAGVGIAVLLTLFGLFFLAPRVPFNIFPPQSDSIDISVSVTDFAAGTTVEEANDLVLAINMEAASALEEELISGYIYDGNQRNALGNYRLTAVGTRPTVPTLIEDRLEPIEAKFSDQARVNFDIVSAGPPEEAFPFKMQVVGSDIDSIENAVSQITDELDGLVFNEGTNEEFRVLETRTVFADSVARSEGERYLQVEARFDSSDVTTVTSATRDELQNSFDSKRLESLGLESDALGFNFGFESENQESFNSVPLAFGVALIAMLILLIIQFRSSTQWMLVILAIPFSFFGVFGGLLITDNSLSFFVMIGLLSLMGIAVNNTILLVDFANQERRDGADAVTAIRTAIERRFRPLVATTFTTIGGLLPLALSDPFWEPLSYTIIFGLISSTFLVLVSFPYFYLALESRRAKRTPPWRDPIKYGKPKRRLEWID